MYRYLASPYSHSDCALTHTEKPIYLLKAEDELKDAEKKVQEFSEVLGNATETPKPSFYAALAEALDEVIVLEKKRVKLSRYWHETGNAELPTPFDAASERVYRYLVSEVL